MSYLCVSDSLIQGYRANACAKWHAERFLCHAVFWSMRGIHCCHFVYCFCPASCCMPSQCMNMYTFDFVQTIYIYINYRGYQIRLSAKYLYTNQKWWEVLTGYLSLGLAVNGRICETGHKGLQFPWQTVSSSSPSYFHIFFLIAFLEEAFIIGIKITLWINCICIIWHNYNNALVNNYLWTSPRPYFALLNPLGHSKAFLRNLWTVWTLALKTFHQP